MRAGLAICVLAAAALVAPAQDTAPASRSWEPVRFHKIDEPPRLGGSDRPAVIARATSGDDVFVVLADGTASYAVVKTYGSDDGSEERPQPTVEIWVARLPRKAVDRIREEATSARTAGQSLSLAALIDLARVPFWIRKSDGAETATWQARHQDLDGSWSPTDLEWNCRAEPVCKVRGQESFRVAATALLHVVQSNAGYGLAAGAPRRALDYLLSRQREDGRFADAADPHAAMTNACGTIALCRASVLAKRDGKPGVARLVRVTPLAVRGILDDQNPDGSWGREENESRKLSTTVWSLLALRAGVTAGIASDSACESRGRTWIERTVEAIEGRVYGKTGPLDVARARAFRAVARLATGRPPAEIAEDVRALVKDLEPGGERIQDAEALLFGTLAAFKCGGTLWDEWGRNSKSHLIESQEGEGCAEGTWTIPSVWSDLGGRLVSTALMTWAIEIYYRYPLAEWVGP